MALPKVIIRRHIEKCKVINDQVCLPNQCAKPDRISFKVTEKYSIFMSHSLHHYNSLMSIYSYIVVLPCRDNNAIYCLTGWYCIIEFCSFMVRSNTKFFLILQNQIQDFTQILGPQFPLRYFIEILLTFIF